MILHGVEIIAVCVPVDDKRLSDPLRLVASLAHFNQA